MKKVWTRILAISIFCCLFMLNTSALTAENDELPIKKLKVCADPNYMPFSNKDKQGYENQIAELVANELNLSVEYMWFPQRMGFIRNTLKKKNNNNEYLCDLVMGVPKEFDFAKATRPYLHTSYALVSLKNGKLESLGKGNDLINISPELLADLKVGITERSPGAVWLAKYGLFEQMAPYIAQSGDPNEFPSEPMLKDMLAGNIDAAIVWGPTAAYFTRLHPDKIKSLPLTSELGVRFDFYISTAVRYGNDEWKERIESVLKNKAADINKILSNAGIVLLENKVVKLTKNDDD